MARRALALDRIVRVNPVSGRHATGFGRISPTESEIITGNR